MEMPAIATLATNADRSNLRIRMRDKIEVPLLVCPLWSISAPGRSGSIGNQRAAHREFRKIAKPVASPAIGH